MSGKVTRKDLRRFLKKELIQLAKDNDFGFKPKSKMTKIELINLIFTSPQFKVMKDKIQMKPKRKVSQKVLDNLQKGREMRKKDKDVDSNTEYYSAKQSVEDNKENKKEEKLVKPKEELVDEEKASLIPTVVEDKPQFIETQEVTSAPSKLQMENELIPYESVEVDNQRVAERKNQAILQKGANAVSGLSGEQVSVITTEKVDRQQRTLELPTYSAVDEVRDEIQIIDERLEGEIKEGDDKNKKFLEKLKELFMKVKDEKTNKEGFEEEQKEEDINNVNPNNLITIEDFDNRINQEKAFQSEIRDDFINTLVNAYDTQELVSMAVRRSGSKKELAINIFEQSLLRPDIYTRTIKLTDKTPQLRDILNQYQLSLSREKEFRVIKKAKELKQKEQSIKDIESKTGHSSYTMESQEKLQKQKQISDINNNRNATDEQKAAFENRL